MDWSELIYAVNAIPENRRNETATFTIDGREISIIDNIDTLNAEISWDDLEANSIWDENTTGAVNPITLTP